MNFVEERLERYFIRAILSALMLLNCCGHAAASEAEDAVEFMLTGDNGWDLVGTLYRDRSPADAGA